MRIWNRCHNRSVGADLSPWFLGRVTGLGAGISRFLKFNYEGIEGCLNVKVLIFGIKLAIFRPLFYSVI
jgi:hypothetical protein